MKVFSRWVLANSGGAKEQARLAALIKSPNPTEHCDMIYRRVLEPLGFTYELDRSQTDQAQCRFTLRPRAKSGSLF